jgi:uracil-DNA glycosylase
MNSSELFGEILNDARALVEKSASARRKTVAVSPEVAALLKTIGPVSSKPRPEVHAQLKVLEQEVSACTECSLCKTRTQTVFGDGSPDAKVVFVGEAPGYHEDQQGVPFVGPAGKLLTGIIEKGMKVPRKDVYICNVLKCRPPENRDPSAEERAQCGGHLAQQLKLVNPKVICALGGHAAKTLLKTDEGTGRLRGKWHFYDGIPVRVTYHPSYLLHKQDNPEQFAAEKRKVWDDIKAVMRVLNGEEDPRPGDAAT